MILSLSYYKRHRQEYDTSDSLTVDVFSEASLQEQAADNKPKELSN